MKFKIFTGGFIAHAFIMLPIATFPCVFFVIVLVTSDIPNNSEMYMGNLRGSLGFVLIWLVYVSYLLINRKNYFSIVTMNNDGIIVSFLGKPWFEAAWRELKHVGRFHRSLTPGGMAAHWIYFSKTPVIIGKNIRFDAPNNASFQGSGFFMELYKKEILTEVYKHIPKENVVWEGTFMRSKKSKK